MKCYVKNFAAAAFCLGLTFSFGAQNAPAQDQSKPAEQAAPAPAAPAGPTALTTPAITGPLSQLPPAVFDAGPFGKVSANGIVSGYGLGQNNHIPGDDSHQAALSNGQIFLQKADGVFQYYIQAGIYDLPSLGTPFFPPDKSVTSLYGPVPVAYLKLAGKTTSFEIGQLPTLIGAEYTFTFENMNINRGLLWNQETAISRGIQVNQALGKVSLSLSWNDGFYSSRYSWLSGSIAYANGPHAIAFVGAGNLGQTGYTAFANPVQNNGSIYNVIYTYTKGSWIVQPYFQYTDVPTNLKIGIGKGASTKGGAILVNHTFKHGFALPARFEYIASTGSLTDGSVNLMYGPGSKGTTITVTPTFQYGGFFVRGEVAYTHISDFAPGAVFGPSGTNNNQTRVAGEIGFILGNNIEKKP